MNSAKYDYVLFLLLGGMVFSVFCLFMAEIWFSSDAPLFTFLTNLGIGFSSSFFTRLTGKSEPMTTSTTTGTFPPSTVVTTVGTKPDDEMLKDPPK